MAVVGRGLLAKRPVRSHLCRVDTSSMNDIETGASGPLGIEWRVSPRLTDYAAALAEMEARAAAVAAGEARELIWLLEHPPVYTAGTSADPSELVDPRFPVVPAGRGGRYTYHGPGQRVGYLVLDLNKRGRGTAYRTRGGGCRCWNR